MPPPGTSPICLRTFDPSLPPFVSGACISSPCATARVLHRCYLWPKCQGQTSGAATSQRRVTFKPCLVHQSVACRLFHSSTLILQAAAIHLDKVTCSPLPARSGTQAVHAALACPVQVYMQVTCMLFASSGASPPRNMLAQRLSRRVQGCPTNPEGACVASAGVQMRHPGS